MSTHTTNQSDLFKKIGLILSEPFAKRMMLQRIITSICKIVDIQVQVLHHRKGSTMPMVQHNIYDWGFEQFEKRMQQEWFYIDEFNRLDSITLNMMKIKTDYTNLTMLLRLLYKEPIECVVPEIMGCANLLCIQDDIWRQHSNQLKTLLRLARKHETFDSYENSVLQHFTMEMYKSIDESNDLSLVGDPIMVRYQLRHMRVAAEMELFRLETAENRTENAVDSTIVNSVQKIILSETAQGFFQNQIMELRGQITHWSDMYDRDYEKIDQSLTETKWQLQALAAKWQVHRDRFRFFQEQLQYHRERDRQALQLRMQQAEAAALLQQQLAMEQTQPRKRRTTPKKRSKK